MGLVQTVGEPVTGTLVIPAAGLSIRDVDPARWGQDTARNLAIHLWLEAQRSRHTREAYGRDILAWFAWCDDTGVPINDARRPDVDSWRNSLTAAGLAPSTVARKLSAVSSFYSFWLSEQMVTRNPAAHAKRPAVGNQPGSIALTRQQASALLAYTDSLDDRRPAVIVRLLAQTGMRIGELCAARAEDLGMSSGMHTLTVTRKGGKEQQFPIAGSTYERITAHLGDRRDGWLIRTRNGRPLDRSPVRRQLRTLSVKAGLPEEVCARMHPHVLRHSVATLLAEDRVPVHEIQALLGHADIRTTQRYIQHRDDLETSPVHAMTRLLAR
jgi:site-specific recombinase XerD